MSIFDDIQPEEFLALLRNFKIAVEGKGTTTVSGHINYLCMMLRGINLKEFNEIALAGKLTYNNLEHIMEHMNVI